MRILFDKRFAFSPNGKQTLFAQKGDVVEFEKTDKNPNADINAKVALEGGFGKEVSDEVKTTEEKKEEAKAKDAAPAKSGKK